jgi:hypothetical protein
MSQQRQMRFHIVFDIQYKDSTHVVEMKANILVRQHEKQYYDFHEIKGENE